METEGADFDGAMVTDIGKGLSYLMWVSSSMTEVATQHNSSGDIIAYSHSFLSLSVGR